MQRDGSGTVAGVTCKCGGFMAENNRGERMVNIFIHLITHPKQKFSISQLMSVLEIPESERRNVQRDMQSLVDLPGQYVTCEGSGAHKIYYTGLSVLDKLALPNFEDVMLQFAFLQRISGIYPRSAALIEMLIDKIRRNVPIKNREQIDEAYKAITSRVMFMGTPPDIDDTANEKLGVILKAIRSHREIETDYEPVWNKKTIKKRIPLMMFVYQGEIYIGCVRHSDPKAVYALKLSRIKSVKLLKETFVENPTSMATLRKKIDDLSLLDDEEKIEKVELTFPTDTILYAKERPYHRSMKIKQKGDLFHVTMNVCVNSQLIQWILFHEFNDVTVVAPDHLKQKILRFGKSIVRKYR